MTFAKSFSRIAAMLFGLAIVAAASFAATHPLNQPMGMAVDSKGNLYVANYGGNQILVYNSSGQQVSSKTITKNINAPMQVTFDAQGNLWASSLVIGHPGAEYFTEYGANGKQINTTFNLQSNFDAPAFAVDGVGDVWTATPGSTLACNGPGVYSGDDVIDCFFQINPASHTAIAARGPWIAFGSATSASWMLVGSLIGGNGDLGFLGSSGNPQQGVLAMTFDNSLDLYYATDEGFGVSGVWFVNIPAAVAPSLNVNVGYAISGIAADSAHGRLYISNAATNQVQVYSTSTWLLVQTIQ